MLKDHILRHANLNADSEVRIFRHCSGTGIHLRVVDIVEFSYRKGRQAIISDVDKGIYSSARLSSNEAAQRSNVIGTTIPSGNNCCCTLVRYKLVWWNANS